MVPHVAEGLHYMLGQPRSSFHQLFFRVRGGHQHAHSPSHQVERGRVHQRLHRVVPRTSHEEHKWYDLRGSRRDVSAQFSDSNPHPNWGCRCKTRKQLQEHGQIEKELVALMKTKEKHKMTRGDRPPP